MVTYKETLIYPSLAKLHGASFVEDASLVIDACAERAKCGLRGGNYCIASILLHLAVTDNYSGIFS